MTFEEFLQHLKETPRTWKVNGLGHIRNAHGACPLWAVAKQPKGEWNTALATMELDLTVTQKRTICRAADGTISHPRLRSRLLKACRITQGGQG